MLTEIITPPFLKTFYMIKVIEILYYNILYVHCFNNPRCQEIGILSLNTRLPVVKDGCLKCGCVWSTIWVNCCQTTVNVCSKRNVGDSPTSRMYTGTGERTRWIYIVWQGDGTKDRRDKGRSWQKWESLSGRVE